MDRWDQEEKYRNRYLAKQLIVLMDKLKAALADKMFQNIFFKTQLELLRITRKYVSDISIIESMDSAISEFSKNISHNENAIKEGNDVLDQTRKYVKSLWPEYYICSEKGHDFRARAIVWNKMPIRNYTDTCQRCFTTESGVC